MNLGAVDLNLLIVFDAVMRERSVTRAGASIGLSQPAVSHALNRLRYLLADELFVRTPAGMTPTPRAEALAAPIRQSLSELRQALDPEEFDPATSTRHFELAFNNYAAALVAPPMYATMATVAPLACLTIRPTGTLDLADRLDRGELDLALGVFDTPGARFAMAPLLDDDIVIVARRGHPAGKGQLSTAAYAELEQLEISSNLDDVRFIDEWLSEQGLKRHIAIRAPFISAVTILGESNLVANVSRRVALHLMRYHPFEIIEPPYGKHAVQLQMLWHLRVNDHPAHMWLRALAQKVAADLIREGETAHAAP